MFLNSEILLNYYDKSNGNLRRTKHGSVHLITKAIDGTKRQKQMPFDVGNLITHAASSTYI